MKYFEFTCYYFIWTVRTCQSLETPRHGYITYDDPCEEIYNIYGSSCTATCDNGYDLSGVAKRTCKEDGKWTGSDVECKSK